MAELISMPALILDRQQAWELEVDADHLLACELSWRTTADRKSGEELVRSLQSSDPNLRLLAETLLTVNGRQQSLELLESALAAGWLSPDLSAQCMVELVCRRISGEAPVANSWSIASVSRC